MDAVPEMTKYLVQAGIGAVLAGFMFWFYRVDQRSHADTVRKITQAHADELRELLSEARADRHQLIEVIVENTKSNQQLVSVTDALHRRLDAIEMLRLQGRA